MGAEGVRCNRCYQIMKDDEVLINAISEWVIIDASSRTLRKVETTSYPNDIDWIKEKSIEERFRRFKDDFTVEDLIYKRLVRSGDIDVTHHTNNVTYITMLLDTFSVKELEAKQWEDVEVSYLNESFEGETLSIYRKEREDGYYFSIKKDDGKVVLMAFFKDNKTT
jgi:acyl-ACP thioesterase